MVRRASTPRAPNKSPAPRVEATCPPRSAPRRRRRIAIKTKLGGPFSAAQVVVTIAGADGNATGQTAVMHGDEAGHYMFRHSFARPGPHVVRIFPSETEAMWTFELDVQP